MPRLEMVSASQPLQQQPSIGALRTRTLASHHIKRATFGTLAGDLSLSWLNRLSDLFQLPAPSMPAPVAVSESTTHLSLEDCALGYMPPAAPAAAAQSLHATAFVAFARGLHTYTVGSARHVDVTCAHVAAGRVRSGGLAPWACTPPATGWSVQTCAALGLDLIVVEDAVSVVLDPSAPVDSDAVDAQPLHEPRSFPSSTPGMQLAAREHNVIGHSGTSDGGRSADPLLAHVQQRRAADERTPAVAAMPPVVGVPVLGAAATGAPSEASIPQAPTLKERSHARSSRHGGHVYRMAGPTPGEPVGSSSSGSSEGAHVFGGSYGDSDVEILSGRDACMMAITRLKLQRLSIMLTPDSCALVHTLAEQLAALFAAQRGGGEGGSPDVAGGGACHSADIAGSDSQADSLASTNTEACVEQHPAALDAHGDGVTRGMYNTAAGCAAACPESEATSTGAPAWPGERSEHRFEAGGSAHAVLEQHEGDTHGRHPSPHSPAEPVVGLACSSGRGGPVAWDTLPRALSTGGVSEPVVHAMALSGSLEEGLMSSIGHSIGLNSSASTSAPASTSGVASPVASAGLDQTLFVDASSTLIASTALARSDLASPNSPVVSESGARVLLQPDATLVPADASPRDIMHDMMLAGGSVVAVGTCAGARWPSQGLSSAGIPTEQEADGVVLPELHGTAEGLLGAVVETYVGAEAALPPPRLQEPVTGRLGANYPDSCQRFSVAAQSVTILLRPDGVSTADLAAATRVRGGGLVRLQLGVVRIQHDVFPESVANHMRVAAAARSVTAQQAGFGARSRALLRKDGTVQWRPLATLLPHGPSDPRRDVARILLRINDTEHGTREASAWLRLPSLRLHLEQPCLLFLRVCAS